MQDRTKEFAMRKVVVSEFVSLDGVMEAPDQWHNPYWNDEMGKYKSDELAAADALLLGRTTYELFAAAWPSMTDEEGGAEMNGYPKHVVSTTLEEPLEWNNSTLIKGDVAEGVARLKQQDGKDILVYGSAELANALMEHDLVDEYRLMVFPVVVGKGKRLFGDGLDTAALKLVDTKVFGSGVVVLTYRPAQS
jgi:dihydrofolate reductase